MNIRRRLQISNLLMIAVPAAAAIAVGAVLICAAWLVVTGKGVGRSDVEDFAYEANAAAELAAPALAGEHPLDAEKTRQLEQALDANGLVILIESSDGETAYSRGAVTAEDLALKDVAAGLEAPANVTSGNRAVAVRSVTRDGVGSGSGLTAYVFGDVAFGSKGATKGMVVAAAGVLAAVVIAAVVAVSRFLTSFVLRHVTEPLDELVAGVGRLSEGDLSYRLPAGRDDEFAPVFEDFNQMAGRLESLVALERKANDQRRDLVVGLSHDLKSPLTSIQAYAEGILDGIASAPAAQERYLRTIVEKCLQMRNQLNQIALVFRMDAETSSADLRRIDLRAFVAGWLARNGEAHALAGARVELAGAETEAALYALADPELLARVLANLLDNCVKYARDGRESCRVLIGMEAEASTARLTVADDGPGVPDKDLSRVFDPFFRADAARTNPTEGSGVGLAVVAAAMRGMGGEASARRSEALGGLEVVLEFPLAADGPEEAGEKSAPTDAPNGVASAASANNHQLKEV